MDPERLTSTFQSLRASLKSLALRITHSEEDADDALQDAFIRLWSGADSIGENIRLEGYITRTVRNHSVDSIRSRKDTVAIEAADDFKAEEPPPDSREIYEEIRTIIDRELPPLQKGIMLLRDTEHLEFNEISSRLNIPEATVRVYLSRARATVRKIYRMRNEQ